MRWCVRPAALEGAVEVPGDKSIAHRALMLGALARGATRVNNLPNGADVCSTGDCLRTCGIDVTVTGTSALVRSFDGLRAPQATLDAGNSGTTMRLLSGILAGHTFVAEISGDGSLSRRPMERVAEPLRRMGATVETTDGHAPLRVRGGSLRGIRYDMPVASAQVKSAVLLAGLFAEGITEVREPVPSRDHTERMLAALGVDIVAENGVARLRPGRMPYSFEMTTPGDASSAAFFLTAAALGGATVTVRNVSLNPTRSALLTVLVRMGAQVTVCGERVELGEPVGDVTVSGDISRPIEIGREDVPLLIDEIPLIALLATQLRGKSVIAGAEELRIKESDRIAVTARILTALGAAIRERPDGLEILGPTGLRGARVTSDGDHRMVMLAAVAGSVADGDTVIEGAEAAAVSYPDFPATWQSIGGAIDVD